MNQLEDTLKKRTGKGRKYWMDYIGKQIARSAKFEGDRQEYRDWMDNLVQKVWEETVEKRLPDGADGNILASWIVGLITTLWACRVATAKSQDPRRPLSSRRKAVKRLQNYKVCLLECMTDDSQDVKYFPAQNWHLPFTPQERNKKYE